MARKKQEEEAVEPVEEAPEEVKVEGFIDKTELEAVTSEQEKLLALRELMVSCGIDSISKLDALLGQVNQRVKELTS